MKLKIFRRMLLMLLLLLLCGGCQAMKRMLNEEPRKRPRPVRAQGPREVFPGSSRSAARPPSILDGELSEEERDAMKSQKLDNRLPARDYNKIRQEDKAASNWVFGR